MRHAERVARSNASIFPNVEVCTQNVARETVSILFMSNVVSVRVKSGVLLFSFSIFAYFFYQRADDQINTHKVTTHLKSRRPRFRQKCGNHLTCRRRYLVQEYWIMARPASQSRRWTTSVATSTKGIFLWTLLVRASRGYRIPCEWLVSNCILFRLHLAYR